MRAIKNQSTDTILNSRIRMNSEFKISKKNFIAHSSEREDTIIKKKRDKQFIDKSANDNKPNRQAMIIYSNVTVPSRVKKIYATAAEAFMKSANIFLIFLILSLIVSGIHLWISGGTQFANALSVSLLAIGTLLSIYNVYTKALSISQNSMFKTIKSKNFWIFTCSFLLFMGIILFTPDIISASINIGWVGILKSFNYDFDRIRAVPLDAFSYIASVMIGFLLFKKLFFMIPISVDNNKLKVHQSWKMANLGFWGNIGFWLTMIAISVPFLALGYGFSIVRSTNFFAQIVTSLMLLFTCFIQMIIYAAASAVYYKEYK